jgi:lipopolysaccharide/colanic/teichoic acid biosynthesis glycosyltransferase
MLVSNLDEARKDSVLSEEVFQATLTHERRRAERSRKPFVLMLLDAHQENGLAAKLLNQTRGVVAASIRETDLLGWYKKDSILGVIFTELGVDEGGSITEILQDKVAKALQEKLGPVMAAKIVVSLHLFPENWDRNLPGWVADSKLYPDIEKQEPQKKASLGVKRLIDIAGSAALLFLLLPVLAAIAIIIKLTSKGPVLFEQERLGQFGARFKCLKFRSMYTNCDSKIHQEYVQQFIAGRAESNSQGEEGPAVYKITNDPRVTPIGRFLRKTSLDEFPQFWNVLRGEMSLVGPRPPVAYEFEMYDVWHRRRVLELKPGVTGLWQVSGRSSTQFDDMVRLDLRYCQSWSLWLDLKILIATPWAVFSGNGAY